MFTLVADADRRELRLNLSGEVTVAALNARACEARLQALKSGSVLFVDLTGLQRVEPEAQGALLFLIQQAQRVPGLDIVIVAPRAVQQWMAATHVRRLLQNEQVRVFETVQAAEVYARQRRAA